MAFDRLRYLQPSGLCDFDRSPAIRRKARSLTSGARNRRQKFERVYSFVKKMPYGLEDWDLKASETIRKGWGMCSGKTNLLIALLRSVGIPARYRVYRIRADTVLWSKLEKMSSRSSRMGELGEERDHVDCEVWLGKWEDCDPGRDPDLEKGLVKLGGKLERPKVTDHNGIVRYLRLANYDDWIRQRQQRRTFRSDRMDIFDDANKGFEFIREIGRSA
ncbi:MAG: transglutaminase domain-containing protein [Dehalococcoidia bacterium]|nr:transglutaminase domain-containing protein [Dehalococcoidia bacterium]